jgi:tRNA G46 methylase TrmB
MVFAGLENVMVLGGDALAALQQGSVAPHGVLEVFINFPEPPVWEHSKHCLLLDAPFFTLLHRSLQKGGALTLLTDDHGVCVSACKALNGLPSLYRSKQETEYSTKVPDHYGSSYFDRLWSHGDRRKRYFLYYDAL